VAHRAWKERVVKSDGCAMRDCVAGRKRQSTRSSDQPNLICDEWRVKVLRLFHKRVGLPEFRQR